MLERRERSAEGTPPTREDEVLEETRLPPAVVTVRDEEGEGCAEERVDAAVEMFRSRMLGVTLVSEDCG